MIINQSNESNFVVRAVELARDQVNQSFYSKMERTRNPQTGMISPDFQEEPPTVEAVLTEAQKIVDFVKKNNN